MNEVEALINQSEELRTKIYQLLHIQKYSTDTKNILIIAYVDIVLQHHDAVSLLVTSKLLGSALALVRPLFEGMFRALWVNECATKDQIEKIAADDDFKFPTTSDLVALVDLKYTTQDFSKDIKRKLCEAMCSYRHSGLLQISRRFSGNYVQPNYKDHEIR